MQVEQTAIRDLVIIHPRVFADERGFFLETWNAARYREAGIADTFVQDNWSRSERGSLRGLHFQHPNAQGKLVSCSRGSVWDVAVDLRPDSPTRLQWFGIELSEANKKQLWVPKGFAHGFCVTSECADFIYKCSETYRPENEKAIRWNDPALDIKWPLDGAPKLSKKDAAAPLLSELEATGLLP